jgi:DNA-binding transcriptional regulator YbjK
MAPRPRSHRASAQARRTKLLEAAAELAAELGAGAVTHRAVAARAGVPLSTTSYFFDSIDDLVTEALRLGARERVAEFDEAERAAVEALSEPVDEVIDAVAERAIERDRRSEAGQIEFFLAAGRQPELRPEATEMVMRDVTRIAAQFRKAGAARPEEVACLLAGFFDGAMLHSVADIDCGEQAGVRSGLRLAIAAAMLSDAELADLLARYQPGAVDDEADEVDEAAAT